MVELATMPEVLVHFGLIQPSERRAAIIILCPFCGKEHKRQRKTMSVLLAEGVFNCPRCGEHGGIMDMYRNLAGLSDNMDNKEVFKHFLKNCRGCGENATPALKHALPKPAPEKPMAPIEQRHAVYSAMLESLVLYREHKEDLLRRGLSEKAIEIAGYKSVPKGIGCAVATDLIKRGFSLDGIPGFYKGTHGWNMVSYGEGFFVPTRDSEGRIQLMQVRLNKEFVEKGLPKYLTMSTDPQAARQDGALKYPGGTKSKALPHVRTGKAGGEKIIITEGPLKADVITHITGISTIGVLGVKNISTLPKILKTFRRGGCKKAYVAYDMDALVNPHVKEAEKQVIRMAVSAGLVCSRLVWESGKGLDDYLLLTARELNF